MFYIDTSVFVASFTVETNTFAAQRWLASRQMAQFMTSPWVGTEFHSALAMKVRLEEISLVQRDALLVGFARIVKDSCLECTIDRGHYERASAIVDQSALKLRASDALHLALVADNDATLCTLDQRLSDACKALNIPCEMP
jgi:uncharacterized protein